MKQIFVYVLFLALPCLASAVVSDSSAPLGAGSFNKLQAGVQDVYGYLEADKVYRLEESHFDFKVWEEKPPPAGGKSGDSSADRLNTNTANFPPASGGADVSDSLLVDEGRITQKPREGSARRLSVSQSKVALEASDGRKLAVKSRLSEKRDTLVVYLPDRIKKDILRRLLTNTHLPLALLEEKAKASDYICKLNKTTKKLVCSISYVSQSPLPAETGKKAG